MIDAIGEENILIPMVGVNNLLCGAARLEQPRGAAGLEQPRGAAGLEQPRGVPMPAASRAGWNVPAAPCTYSTQDTIGCAPR